jgi:hypothetical protein
MGGTDITITIDAYTADRLRVLGDARRKSLESLVYEGLSQTPTECATSGKKDARVTTRSSEGVREECTRWLGSTGLSPRYPKQSSQSCWDAEELDRDLTNCRRTRIASQPLLPAETRVRSLRAGQDHAL